MTARISLIQTNEAVRELLLDAARTYVIGRAPDCDICVDDAEMSRQHARFASLHPGTWEVTDLGSKNGLFVAGKATERATLSDGSWIGIGSLAIRFELLNNDQVARASSHEAELRSLTQQGRAHVATAGGVEEILRQLLSSVLKISGTQRGFAMLTRPDGDLEVACSEGVAAGAGGDAVFQGSRGAVREVLSTRTRVVTCDARVHEALAMRKSIIAAQTGALVCLPLAVLERVVGVIYADTPQPGKFFTELDLQLLEELSDHAAVAVAASQLGMELDDIGDRLGDRSAGSSALATVRHRIPDVARRVAGGRVVPMTGLRWSNIEAHV